MTLSPDDDQDRISMVRLADGRDGALDDLMTRHGGRLFRYLLRSLQNEEEAADLAQETFVRVHQTRARFDPRQKFSTWLYAIASNLVRDRYRWRARHPEVPLDACGEVGDFASADPARATVMGTPRDELQSAERAEIVRRAVAALPAKLRQPLILAEWEYKPQEEIATILNCTVKAVETRIYRARHRLRDSLAQLLEGA